MTRSIQALERELDLSLFDRGKGGVRPTREGNAIIQRARTLLLQAEGLDREIRQIKNAEKGSINFGIGPAIPSLFLPELLIRVQGQQPTLSVDITIDSPPQLLERLSEDLIDFFIADTRSLPQLNPQLFHQQKIISLQPALYVRRDHPLTQVVHITHDDLRRYTLLSLQYRKQGSPEEDTARQALSRYFCNDLATLRQLVMKSDAVLLGLTSMVRQELQEGSIAELKFHHKDFAEPGHIALITKAGRKHSAAGKLVLDQLWPLLEEILDDQ